MVDKSDKEKEINKKPPEHEENIGNKQGEGLTIQDLEEIIAAMRKKEKKEEEPEEKKPEEEQRQSNESKGQQASEKQPPLADTQPGSVDKFTNSLNEIQYPTTPKPTPGTTTQGPDLGKSAENVAEIAKKINPFG